MDKNLFYCDYDTCMLLKRKGFNEMCDAFYGDAFICDGEYISPDHEYEYRVEGKKVDVEHGGWVYRMNNQNHDGLMDAYTCSLVPHPVAVKWLFEKTGVFITVNPYADDGRFLYACDLHMTDKKPDCIINRPLRPKTGFKNPEDAYEYGIRETAKQMEYVSPE